MKRNQNLFVLIISVLFVFSGCVSVPKDTQNIVPEKEEVQEPIVQEQPMTEEISLYYYNQIQDKDATGNALCSENAILPLKREIAKSEKIIEDTLNFLLKGEITQVEKDQGFSTEYPLPGFSL